MGIPLQKVHFVHGVGFSRGDMIGKQSSVMAAKDVELSLETGYVRAVFRGEEALIPMANVAWMLPAKDAGKK